MRSGKRRKKERPSRSLLFHILIWALEIVFVVILAYGASRLFFRTVRVQDSSMEPTIAAGDVMLMDKIAYRFGSPDRGDLIAYRNTDEPTESLHVKRIIGLPGETVQIVNGQILIDGETYVENGEFPVIIDPGAAAEPIALQDDEYFVLGDNRNGSDDSRYASAGNVRSKRIAGKVWFRIRPVTRIGGL